MILRETTVNIIPPPHKISQFYEKKYKNCNCVLSQVVIKPKNFNFVS